MFNIVLLEPDIPQNTGNIARLAAANDYNVILVGKLGFELTDRYLKRAGLDYWEYVRIKHYEDKEAFFKEIAPERLHYLTKTGDKSYTEMVPKEGDYFVFGSETRGIDKERLNANRDRCYKIPMKNPGVRSLNLATSVGIVMYHAQYKLDLGQ